MHPHTGVAILVGVVLAAACTTAPPRQAPSPQGGSPSPADPAGTPAPPAGGYVGVVLAPPGEIAGSPGTSGPSGGEGIATRDLSPLGAALRAAAERLTGVSELGVERVRVLAPPAESFRGDEMEFLARDGADVVCTIGNVAELVARLAPRHPGTAFCLLDAVLPSAADNVASAAWNEDEIAFLTGAATALAAGNDSVGVVAVGAEGVAVVERRRAAFDAGARHVRPAVRVRPRAVTVDEATDGREAARTAASELFADTGARTGAITVVGRVPALEGAAQAAASGGGVLVGWGTDLERLLGEDTSGVVGISVVKRVDVALVAAIRRVREGSSEPLVFGPADDAVTIVEGPAHPPRAVTRVRRLAADLAAGSVQIPIRQREPGQEGVD